MSWKVEVIGMEEGLKMLGQRLITHLQMSHLSIRIHLTFIVSWQPIIVIFKLKQFYISVIAGTIKVNTAVSLIIFVPENWAVPFWPTNVWYFWFVQKITQIRLHSWWHCRHELFHWWPQLAVSLDRYWDPILQVLVDHVMVTLQQKHLQYGWLFWNMYIKNINLIVIST